MKFSYSWLKQLVDIKLQPQQLAEFLSLHAFETEIVESGEFPNIIIAKVTKIEKHPNADRLRIITLTDDKNIYHPVVCGAWNFDEGAVVPLALPGATIPHDQHDPEGKPFTLSKATIRGVESQGMICSGKELGLSDDGKGILILNQSSKLGETFTAFESNNDLLDISVPANRPDLMSYRGVAFEIAALTGKKYLVKSSKSQITNLKSKILNVRISDSKLCKKYTATRLTNIKVAPSPKFIQERLKSSGMRPINNVVDITNYVLLEIGQPLHAFDASKVAGAINVRKAYVQENVVTIDNQKRKLDSNMLVIADGKKILALAGVMGGLDSAVDDHTTEIILESANFNAVSVRKTARALGLRTDASSRFEKSLPIALVEIARNYAVELLEKYAGAKAIEFASAGIKSEKKSVVNFVPENVNELLGLQVSGAEQKKILQRLGFKVETKNNKQQASVPSWRTDISIWQDLAEEIVRFKGLNNLKPKKTPYPISAEMNDSLVDARDRVCDLLIGMGFDEVYTYSFVSKNDLNRWQIEDKIVVEVANPISTDQQFMRPNLALNVLKVVEHNSNYAPDGSFFEIGNIYWKENGSIREKTYLFMMSYSKTKNPLEALIGSFRALCQRLGIEFILRQDEEELAQIIVQGKPIGSIGRLNVSDLNWVGVNLDFEQFAKFINHPVYKPTPKYPSIDLDVAIVVSEDLPWSNIKAAIKHNLVSEVMLFDVYTGKNITTGKKSMAFRIIYQAPNRTLTDEEVVKIHKQILETLKQKFSAIIRD